VGCGEYGVMKCTGVWQVVDSGEISNLPHTANFFDVTGNFQGGAGKFIWRAAQRETPVFSAWMEF
jgi:hypothetical protein